MKPLHERLEAAAPVLEETTAKDLLRSLKNVLRVASNEGRFKAAPHEIEQGVKATAPPPDLQTQFPSATAIVGGNKAFRRDPALAILKGNDETWIHFTITVKEERGSPLYLVAYAFEIVFAPGACPSFVRIDLNPPAHPNQEIGLRSHLHPGSDDMSVPAPILSPVEALELMVGRLNTRKG